MATTDARPGFRLPWGPDRSETGDPADGSNETDPTDRPATDGQAPDGPTDVAPGLDTTTADQEIETPDMIDAVPAASDPVAAVDVAPGGASSADVADPVAPDAAAEAVVADGPAAGAAASSTGRRQNKFLADLTKAMQVAAETARKETLARLSNDAKTHIEEIHATSATEATDLRKRADDDVAAIREWSKAEIARIREETDHRVNDRKANLELEIEEHAAAIERRIERVQSRVASFESEMDAFFERLLAEDDPTRFAAMAESLPEAPSLDLETAYVPEPPIPAPTFPAAQADGAVDPTAATEPAPADAPADAPAEAVAIEAAVTEPEAAAADGPAEAPASADDGDLFSIAPDAAGADPRLDALGLTPDFAAAEAEAAAFTPGEAVAEDEIPTIADEALAARLAGLVPEGEAGAASSTRVVVTGLVSVASIAGFKRHLSRADGVQSVGVSSGPEGEFVFAVNHDPSIDLRVVVPGLPGFGARVTGERDGDLTVTAHDPESEG